jgi:hypothetical protein
MAYVGAVYTIDRLRRTTDEVLDEMARRARTKERPRPQHKRVWAEMTQILEGEPVSGCEWLFCDGGCTRAATALRKANAGTAWLR